MHSEFKTKTIPKSDSSLMAVVKYFVPDPASFMAEFTTTVGHGIYIPFVVGVPSGAYNLWRQVQLCVHEHQHVVQYDRDGSVVFGFKYLFNKAARTAYEVEAYRSDMELQWWRDKTIPDPKWMASRLSSYGVDAANIRTAEIMLISTAITVRSGGVANVASKKAIAWLNANAPGIRA
jgi:hypothetical protein